MANARNTLGAVFGTIGTAATTVTSVFETAGKGVSMMENYVDNALLEQRERIAAHSVGRQVRIGVEVAAEVAERKVGIDKFRSQSPVHAAYFDEAYNEVIEAIKAVSAPKEATSKLTLVS